jgi:electron transfer flavoprotein beta subunit
MSVVELELGQGSIKVSRQTERGVEVLYLPLPSLVGVQKGLCEPRVPKVMKVMKAAKAKLDVRNLGSLGLSADDVAPKLELVRYESPSQRGPVTMAKGDFPANVDSLVRLLRDEARVI